MIKWAYPRAGERGVLSLAKTSQQAGKEAKQVVPHWKKTRENKTVFLYQMLKGSEKDEVRKRYVHCKVVRSQLLMSQIMQLKPVKELFDVFY